jgi:hypothetical protein
MTTPHLLSKHLTLCIQIRNPSVETSTPNVQNTNGKLVLPRFPAKLANPSQITLPPPANYPNHRPPHQSSVPSLGPPDHLLNNNPVLNKLRYKPKMWKTKKPQSTSPSSTPHQPT